MPEQRKWNETRADVAITVLIILAALCIPVGLFLTFYLDNAWWLLLVALAVVFFMAG
jgi:hypothetical protein